MRATGYKLLKAEHRHHLRKAHLNFLQLEPKLVVGCGAAAAGKILEILRVEEEGRRVNYGRQQQQAVMVSHHSDCLLVVCSNQCSRAEAITTPATQEEVGEEDPTPGCV